MSKQYLIIKKVINAASMGADITSPVTTPNFVDNLGYQVQWTSSNAVGTISVQGSNNWDEQNQTGTWFDLTFNPALTQPASNNGEYGINLNQYPYKYLRLKYARSSGTGTFNAWLSGKEI